MLNYVLNLHPDRSSVSMEQKRHVKERTLDRFPSPSSVTEGRFVSDQGDPPRRRRIGGCLALRRPLRRREDGGAPIRDVYIV